MGPYLLEDRLGAGGMGAVWRAWDERLKRRVAIKQVLPDRSHPGARRRFRYEATAGARLNHPAIVHIYDILETDEGEWIVMELVEGQTLARLLEGGPLDLLRGVRLGREIAKGLGKAHLQGIIHRDLKAANVMVTPAGHAKILDFGVAKLMGLDSNEQTLSQPGALLGTPYAMSPEQILGLPLDPRSDLFSFGALLYQMITGIIPFRGETTMATLNRVCDYRPPPVRQSRPEAPPELSELIDWLLEKDSRHRPDSAKEVASVLNGIAAQLAQERSGIFLLARPPRPSSPAEGTTIFEGPRADRNDPTADELSQQTTLEKAPALPGAAEGSGGGSAALVPRADLPMVGREGELDVLVQRWSLVQAGESQVVLISGEPGIGKSRLVNALREELGKLAPRWLLSYGVAHARSSPFYAVIELLRRNWLRPAGTPAEELAILEGLLRQYGLPVDDDLPLLAALLSLPAPEGGAPLPASPETQRQRTLEALLNLLLQATAEEPMVLVVEDLHWLDPSSLELVGALLDSLGDASLLMVLTFRLEFEPPWGHRSGWLQLHLSRFADQDALSLIQHVAGAWELPQKVQEQIVAKSDGVPLFIEELTRSAVESGADSTLVGIPSLLRDSLTSRLDRLGRAKQVAQVAAVLGRSFAFELLAAVVPCDRATLAKELDRLVRAELMVRRGIGERATYGFKHVLLQEAARELLSPQELESLHREVAKALESRFPEVVARQPELLAHHYTQAGEPEKAIERWLEAGRRALQRFANAEALEHLRNGLRLVEALPAGAERDRLELSLQICSVPAVIVSRGHSDDEVEALFDRAESLAQRLGEMPGPFQFLLWNFYTSRGDLQKARQLALQRLQMARLQRDVDGLILGLQELASTQACLGRPRSALRTLRRALALYPPAELASPPLFSGWDAKCHNLCETARTLCDAGFPDTALAYGRKALALAQGLIDPYSAVLALQYMSFLHQSRREHEEAAGYAHRMHDLCRLQGFNFLAAHSQFLLSLQGARLAPDDEAVGLVGEAIQALETLRKVHRQELNFPQFLGWLAEACIGCGMTAEARWLLEDACEISLRTGERLGRAEVFRLQGELLLLDGALYDAQELFQAALAEARAAGSLWLQLRAATSLGRFWKESERDAEARQLLESLLGRFNEGGETADVKAATLLVASLCQLPADC